MTRHLFKQQQKSSSEVEIDKKDDKIVDGDFEVKDDDKK